MSFAKLVHPVFWRYHPANDPTDPNKYYLTYEMPGFGLEWVPQRLRGDLFMYLSNWLWECSVKPSEFGRKSYYFG